jgi:hypothetical protein
VLVWTADGLDASAADPSDPARATRPATAPTAAPTPTATASAELKTVRPAAGPGLAQCRVSHVGPPRTQHDTLPPPLHTLGAAIRRVPRVHRVHVRRCVCVCVCAAELPRLRLSFSCRHSRPAALRFSADARIAMAAGTAAPSQTPLWPATNTMGGRCCPSRPRWPRPRPTAAGAWATGHACCRRRCGSPTAVAIWPCSCPPSDPSDPPS